MCLHRHVLLCACPPIARQDPSASFRCRIVRVGAYCLQGTWRPLHLASLAGEGSLFADAARGKLQQLQAELQPLADRYDVVVANPPYMGSSSSSLGKWNGKWIKENFPEAYRDLCTSFIDRGFSLSNDQGYSAMVTMQCVLSIAGFGIPHQFFSPVTT